MKRFKELYLEGEAELEDIDRYVSQWNFSDEGLSEEEEDVWISDSDEALFELLEAQRKN